MGSTTIRLDDDVYERLRAVKREDESFSDAVDRLLGGGSLLDLVGLWDAETVDEVRDILGRTDEDAVADTDRIVRRAEPE